MLKEEYGAEKVAVFGSLVHPGLFHLRSDIDLAVWGMDERYFYRVVSKLNTLAADFSVDLVAVEHVSKRLRQIVEQEGKLL